MITLIIIVIAILIYVYGNNSNKNQKVINNDKDSDIDRDLKEMIEIKLNEHFKALGFKNEENKKNNNKNDYDYYDKLFEEMTNDYNNAMKENCENRSAVSGRPARPDK